jgi:methionyl-tRNA formyltransferase
MKIVFFGNSEFGLASLEKLHKSPHRIAAVVTNPDKPQGRGRVVSPTPVKRRALETGLQVLEAESLSSPEFVSKLGSLSADLFIVIAYRILPEKVFNLPPRGTINLHPSLLPKYRGAAPIQWALINGEEATGLTTFRIDKNIDSGEILLQEEVTIGPQENFGELSERLAELGGDLILKTVALIEKGEMNSIPQKNQMATPAPKIRKTDCQIDWTKPARQIFNLVRGLSPYPGAFSALHNKILKILRADWKDLGRESASAGEIVIADQTNGLAVQTGIGLLFPTQLQLEGKNNMSVQEFLRGFRIQTGEKLG